MPRVSRVLPHLSVEEVQQKIKIATNFRRQQKWLIIYNALVDPRQYCSDKHFIGGCMGN